MSETNDNDYHRLAKITNIRLFWVNQHEEAIYEIALSTGQTASVFEAAVIRVIEF